MLFKPYVTYIVLSKFTIKQAKSIPIVLIVIIKININLNYKNK